MGGALARLPSEIYWNGLSIWGIRRTRGSRGHYHRSLDAFYRALDSWADEELDGDRGEGPHNWHLGLPAPPEDFPQGATFQLRGGDAAYLQERIFSADRSSLLAFLVEEEADFEPVSFPWQHPVVGRIPADTRTLLEHARNFSEVIHGAALLYNLMMAEAADRSEERVTYGRMLDDWVATMDARMPALRQWDRRRFWRYMDEGSSSIPIPTRRFVDQWLDRVLSDPGPAAVSEDRRARRLISDRELSLKRGRARLHNARALELWGGASGADQLEYRWTQVQVLVQDIRAGLRRGEDHALPE